MFIIYNARMKRQTRNIKYSFILLLVTTVLFSSVALSNQIYNNRYTSKKYDFKIKNQKKTIYANTEHISVDSMVGRLVYEGIGQGQFDFISFRTQRMLPLGFRIVSNLIYQIC